MLTNNPIGFEKEAAPKDIKSFLQYVPTTPIEHPEYDFAKLPVLDNSFLDAQFLASEKMTSLQNLLVCQNKSSKKIKITPTYIQLNSTELKIINECQQNKMFRQQASKFIDNLFLTPVSANAFANLVKKLLTAPVSTSVLEQALSDC